jgi:hypothetical protein
MVSVASLSFLPGAGKGFDLAEGLRRVEELRRAWWTQVPGSLLKLVVVNPEAQREDAEHKARPFFLFRIAFGDC